MDYIIGVDGGATKTEAVAYNMEDEKIGAGLTGAGNLAMDFEVAATNIKNAISQCFDTINAQGTEEECKGIYLGIAGIEVGNNASLIEQLIGGAFHCNVVGLHDSQLAHAAILQGKDGIITIAGTGSVSYGCFKEKTARTGGWGHILGDEGSGYWIALEALKRMTVEYDTEMEVSILSQCILDQLGFHNADGMKEFVHSADKLSIAGIAPIVTALARDGDQNAISILNQAGNELAIMTERLYKRLGVTGPVTIGISGSILCKVDRVQEQFQQCLDRDLGQVRILKRDISPTKGACFLYRNTQKKIQK